MARNPTASARGLLEKGWADAERVARKAETARLAVTTPSAGIEELLHLASIARALAPPEAAPDDDPEHLEALIAASALLRRGPFRS